jgi:hypothetical protein
MARKNSLLQSLDNTRLQADFVDSCIDPDLVWLSLAWLQNIWTWTFKYKIMIFISWLRLELMIFESKANI